MRRENRHYAAMRTMNRRQFFRSAAATAALAASAPSLFALEADNPYAYLKSL